MKLYVGDIIHYGVYGNRVVIDITDDFIHYCETYNGVNSKFRIGSYMWNKINWDKVKISRRQNIIDKL